MKWLWLSVVVLSLAPAMGFLVIELGKKCPKPPVKNDFDVTQYMGKWWEYQRFPAPFEFASTCGSANYTLLSDTRVKVVNAGIQKIEIFGIVLRRKPILAIGEAVVLDPKRPGELKVTFPQSPASLNDDSPNYFVVDTDYENFAVVFSCTDFFIGNFQFAWILTRGQGVRPANLESIYKTLREAGINTKNFITVRHTDCRL
ncbi:apolipoprotein D-like [Babylonia areolata]|uniref:apolipoprotein D-like n=1 Tax=Babylonia areolata TaxID=304850 RepID=UPI003FD68B6C